MALTKNEIKLIKSLQIKKYRDNHRLFVIEGEKMIQELIQQSTFKLTPYFTRTPTIFHCCLITFTKLKSQRKNWKGFQV